MNELLHDPIRHNNWAMKELVRFCRDAGLTSDQLTATGVGSFGGLLATLNHVVRSDHSYVRSLFGEPDTSRDDEDLAGLAKRVDETEALWERLLSAPIDAERVIIVDDGAYEVRAGVFIAQALNHANHHREQVCAILTALGAGAPDIQAWEYAWGTGRIWERTAPKGEREPGRGKRP